jgi:hypothetical protein
VFTCLVPPNKVIINEEGNKTEVFYIILVVGIVIVSFRTEIKYCWIIKPKIAYQSITLPNRFSDSKIHDGLGLLGSDVASFG